MQTSALRSGAEPIRGYVGSTSKKCDVFGGAELGLEAGGKFQSGFSKCRGNLPQIAMKMAKKTVPPLSNKWVT